jgi:hypothetical protein
LVALVDVVVGYSNLAALHASLKNCFIDLEIDLLKWDGSGDFSVFHERRLAIERDEPPIYRALDVLCYDEVCRAEGVERPAGLPRANALQRMTCHFLKWENIANA